jgi:uncharacterized protein (TIGR02145 family)
MKRSILLAVTALTLFSCSKGGSNDATPTNPTNTVSINGTDYGTVKIGNKTWTTVNYNGTGGLNYSYGTNDAKYGKLYLLSEAKAISLPTGWRIPTQQDFTDLMGAAGQTTIDKGNTVLSAASSIKLRSTSDWNYLAGTNTISFNAYPAGSGSFDTRIDPNKATFDSKGEETTFWGSDQGATGVQYCLTISSYKDAVGGFVTDYAILTGQSSNNIYFSLRFVKDN